jgi:hypothetical protein
LVCIAKFLTIECGSHSREKRGGLNRSETPTRTWLKPDFWGSPSASSRFLTGDAIWRLIQQWPISFLNIVPSELSAEEPGAADQSANRYS